MGNKEDLYRVVTNRIDALCEGETDHISLMSTIACELFESFDYFDWVGFYRNVGHQTLKVGPYQGGHGCLVIPFDKGVCGAAARTQKIQNIPDVNAIENHIACSGSTRSEIVLPIVIAGEVLAVLDVDSDRPAIFDEIDERYLSNILRVFDPA